MNGTQAKVCLFIAIFKFKVALLDRVTQTVQTRLRSDRDYNTTIGSIRGYGLFCYGFKTYFMYTINVTQIICLFFVHSLNKAFYFQECTLITSSPWCNPDLVNPYLVGLSSSNQS